MVKYGVVGTGYFGAELARYMQKNDGAEITLLYDPDNAEAIAEELGAKVASSLDELVSSDEVDCVIVATPNNLHKEPVIKAAQHGKNVFCEKPIALSYQDCREMVDACKENNVTFMAGHIMNFFNGVHHAKELINQGVIGDVLYCHTARNGWEEQQPSVSWKKIREKSGGHLYHHIHELDCVQFLMGGMPETVTMTGGNVAHEGENFGDEDDKGTLKLDGQESYFLIHESQEEDDDRTRIYHSTEMDGAIAYGKPGKRTPLWLSSVIDKEMRYLHEIMQGAPVSEEFAKLLTGEAALEAIATADACTQSMFEDRKVKLSEIVK